MTDREVRVRLTVDNSGLRQGLAQSQQQVAGLNRDIESGSQRAQQSVAGTGKAYAALKGAIAGAAVGAFLSDSISKASDLNETLNKAATIFGKQSAEMEKWASNAARTLGLSKAAALDAAAGFGDMFSQLGFTGDQAASMSRSTVQLAADLGSFNNLGTDEVLDKISGAMRGEYDSLQALIPNINAARVEKEALAASGKKAAAELTAQEKATATLAIITKDGARAQGDFAKTADGLANSQKIARAEIEDAQAKIGQGLLPVMQNLMRLVQSVGVPILTALGAALGVVGKILTPVVSAVEKAVGWFGQLPGPVKAVVTALAALATLKLLGVFSGLRTAVGAVLSPLQSLRMQMATQRELAAATGQAYSRMGAVARGVGAGLKSMGSSLLGAVGGPGGLAVTAALGLITFGFQKMAEEQARAKAIAAEQADAIRSVTQALAENNGVIDDNILKQQYQKLATAQWGRESQGLLDLSTRLGVSQRDLVAATAGEQGAYERVTAAIAEKKKAIEGVDYVSGLFVSEERERSGLEAKIAREQIAVYEERMQSAKMAADRVAEYNAATTARAGAQQQSTTATAANTAEQQRLNDALIDGAKSQQDAYLAHLQYAAAQGEAEARARVLAELEAGTAEAVREVESAASPAALAVQALADAQSELDQSVKEVLAGLDKLAGRVPSVEQANADLAAATDDMAAKFGVGTDEVQKFDAAILNADGTVKTADKSGRDLRDSVLSIRDAQVTAAQAAYQTAQANGDLLGAQSKANAAAQQGYKDFMAVAGQLGLTEGQARTLAGAYGLIPDQVVTTIVATDNATGPIQQITGRLKALDGTVIRTQVINTQETIYKYSTVGQAARWMGGKIPGYAQGTDIRYGILGIPGPADPRQDNLFGVSPRGLFRFRGDEFITNPKASKAFGPILDWMNRAVPGFAGGGAPSAASLAGLSPRQLGARESITVGALGDLAAWIKDIGVAASESRVELKEALKAWAEARAEQAATAKEQRNRVAEAKAGAKGDRKAADLKLAEAKRERAQKLAEAQAAIRSAKTFSERARAYKEHDQANRETAKALRDATADRSKVYKKAAEDEAKAVAAQRTANAAEAQKVRAANSAAAAAKRAAAADEARQKILADDLKRTARLRALLPSLSRSIDQTTDRLAAAKDKLADLKGQRTQIAGSVASALGGNLAGLGQFTEQRRTMADYLRGAAFDQKKAKTLDAQMSKVAALGLDGDLLQQLASADPQAIAAFAGGTKAQIAQYEKLVRSSSGYLQHAGKITADATVGKAITDQNKVIAALSGKLSALNNIDVRIGKAVAAELNSQMRKLGPNEVYAMTKAAQAAQARR